MQLNRSFLLDSNGQGVALAHEVIEKAGKLRVCLNGKSMLPILWSGVKLTIVSCVYEDLKPGDLVMFQRGEQAAIHRVLRRERSRYVTQGDGLRISDGLLETKALIGRVQGFAIARYCWTDMPERLVHALNTCLLLSTPSLRILIRALSPLTHFLRYKRFRTYGH